MAQTGVLIGFYQSIGAAKAGLRALRRSRFRAALIHKSVEGRVRVRNLRPCHGALLGAAVGVLAGLLARSYLAGGAASFGWPAGPWLLWATSGLAGLLVGCLGVRLLRLGVDRSIIEALSARMVRDEAMVLVQASLPRMVRALDVLRATGQAQPAVFALHPSHVRRTPLVEPLPREPLTPDRLRIHARRLALAHRVEREEGRGEPPLEQLREYREEILHVGQALEEAVRLEQGLSPTSEWLLDNIYIVLGHIRDVRVNLPRRYYHELPVLAEGPDRGAPRVYKLACELVGQSDGRIDRENISRFLEAYQAVSPLNIGELWALPMMLRVALIETVHRLARLADDHLHDRQSADLWANRLLAAARRDPDHLPMLIAEIARERPGVGSYFAYQLTEHLYDEQAALGPVESWVESKLGQSLPEIIVQEQGRQAANQVSIANAILSLRRLALLDWREVFEQHSEVERILRQDPADIHSRMDFATRDRYRQSLEAIARRSTMSQAQVAELALELARRDSGDGQPTRRHVGHYLVGPGRAELEARAASRPTRRQRALRWVYRHSTAVYLGAIGLVTLAVLACVLLWAGPARAGFLAMALTGLLAALPASELAVRVVNYLASRLLPPRPLPKMSFEKQGIPDQYRTLAVVPMLLLDHRTVEDQVRQMEVNYLANHDPNLFFALFTDYSDCPEPTAPEDEELLAAAVAGVEELNARHGPSRFLLFHRRRSWAECEQRWIGWERKRGKLEELNRLICGLPSRDGEDLLRVGDPELVTSFRYVITLDADTQLPLGTARRLIETLAHPLNRPRVAPDSRTVGEGYSVIQPRVSTRLPSATASLFARVTSDSSGLDPYTRLVSDAYQDLAGEASYQGKGIYDPRIFHQVLAGRFPEQSLLSHDLIEGAHVRTGLASDVELLDDFPPTYLAHASREHRWIRGDWQIAEYCLPVIPVWNLVIPAPARRGAGGKRRWAPNPLNGLNRWKVFDNLRRSLVAPSLIMLLAAVWLLNWASAAIVGGLVAVLLLFPAIAQLASWLVRWPPGSSPTSWTTVRTRVVQSLVEAAMLPYRACLGLDAIVRVCCRRLVSRRQLLEWTSSRIALWESAGRTGWFLVHLGLVSVLAGGLAAAVWVWNRPAWPGAGPFLALWMLSPLVGWALNLMPRERRRQKAVSPDDRRLLRELARRTWRYFDEFIEPETHWLPPDNYQVSHRVELASRTSPTNIGLALLAGLAARDLGYLTADRLIERTSNMLDTLDSLERYEGHLLNWYDISTLKPLQPRYVSFVDSGNLRSCLWTLQQGLGELAAGPLVTADALSGLADTLAMLQLRLARTSTSDTTRHAVTILGDLVRDPPAAAIEIIGRLRLAAGPAQLLAAAIRQDHPDDPEALYWADQMQREVDDWQRVIDGYLGWVEELARATHDQLAGLGPQAEERRQVVLAEGPSLRELASGLAWADGQPADSATPAAGPWQPALARARQAARGLLDRVGTLAGRCRELADGMNMRFLYDPARRLFTVGFDVADRRRDDSFYDLLASEARLASFVAIAGGDVSGEHWLAMGRPFNSVHGRRVMLSWSGTMFEFLMPLLLMRTYENSLLELTCRNAVRVQIDYGRRQGVPWGMSEAAFGALDANQIYQYKAFGVPGLGLKRGLGEEVVVAPYAAALALAVLPDQAAGNLRRMAQIGLLGEYGLFESIDYSRARRPEGEPGVIVHSYMAHHQAMTLLALDNFLCDRPMVRRFHADPRVRGSEPLLFERIPLVAPLFQTTARDRPPGRLLGRAPISAASRFDTANTPTPATHIQSNGRYALMVTNAGGGFSRLNDIDLTRWRADTTRDDHGLFCYLRDTDSGQTWSAAYQPMRSAGQSYSVHFTADHAEFRRTDDGIETVTEVVLSPEDDAEIRRVTLINRSARIRRLELTSYVELALAPHADDRAHPLFARMFIQTEAVPSRGLLLAHRRRRSPDERPVWAAHLVTSQSPGQPLSQYETDRARFIGRGRTTADPLALWSELSNSTGAVLDPIFSIRRTVTLEPGQRAQLAVVLAAAESRESAAALAGKFADLRAVNRAFEMAWSRSQLELRHLRIQPPDAHRFQELAGHLLYPSGLQRPSMARLRQNRLSQQGLWPLGISGDLPIAAITIGDLRDIEPVRELLVAHSYWRTHGLTSDLVILSERASGYDSPLVEHLSGLIQSHAMLTGVNRPGGVFFFAVDQLPREQVTLLLASARVVLVATRGPLAQQLGIPGPFAEPSPPLAIPSRPEEEPSPPLPFLELPYFNGLGGFTPDGREYAIYLGPNRVTPAPWVNVMANPGFGQLVTESGGGFVWAGNSQNNRLTDWSNDPVCDPPAEAVFIRDEDSGACWAPTPLPIRELDPYRIRHGAGYTVFEHNSHAIEQELLSFVPMDEQGGLPVRILRLRLRSCASHHRRLTATFYAELALGPNREQMQMHVVSQWDAHHHALLARNYYNPDAAFGGQIAFVASSVPPASYTADRTPFLGRNGNPGPPGPAAMRRIHLANRTGAGLDPCAALRVPVELDPGQVGEVVFVFGQAADAAGVARLAARFQDPVAVEECYQATRAWWDQLLGAVQVRTPCLSVDFMLNRWLPYQTLSCRLWGRSAFYQSGGAFGFRDQLQDVLGLLPLAPGLAREHILRSAGRQYIEGDVQHWWHPDSGTGVRSRCSDDLLWLPFAVAEYVRVTGDYAILDAVAPFVEGPPLADDQAEDLQTPRVSSDRGSVFEHCRRAIERSRARGPHGLPLIGSGDWNDGFNRVGTAGRGESVWLAWFLIAILRDFAELARTRNEDRLADEWLRQADDLVRAVERSGWDGQWYRRGFFDDGAPLGSAASQECQIDSIAQSWAVLSGAGRPDRTSQALRSCLDRLVRRDDRLVLLFDPPFDRTPADPGYVKGYPPGLRENGAQYTHAAVWLAMALARAGEGDQAAEILQLLNPIESAREPAQADRFRVEPYVACADVRSSPPFVGRGGWTWYTGSAGWMYRAWLEEVLGVKRRGRQLLVEPVIPTDWPGYTVDYRVGGTTYRIEVSNPEHVSRGVARVELDGKPLKKPAIDLRDDGKTHHVAVVLGGKGLGRQVVRSHSRGESGPENASRG